MSVLESPWMEVREVMAYARCGKSEVLGALADESLRGSQLKPGGKWRVHRADVDSWLRGEKPDRQPEQFIGRRRSA